jgi:hypothetical protein
MNWSTRETILVVDAAAVVGYSSVDDPQRVNGVFVYQGEWVIWTQLGLVPLRALGGIPGEHGGAGNVYIAAMGCDGGEPSALAARLFMRRLDSVYVWDGQVGALRTLQELETEYLEGHPLETTDLLVDEMHHLCAIGDGRRWYDKQDFRA